MLCLDKAGREEGRKIRRSVACLLLAFAIGLGALGVAACGGSDAEEEPTEVAPDTGAAGATATAESGAESAPAEEGDINIGAVGPLSGLYSIVGISQEAGIKLAIEDIGPDGINGRKIAFHSEDDELDPEKGVSALLRLVDDAGIQAVFGSTVTRVTEAMANEIEGFETPIPQVGVVGSDDVIYPDGPGTPPRPFVFGVLTGNYEEIARLANYIAENYSDKRIALIHDDTTYGQGGEAYAISVFDDLGIELVANEELPEQTPDPSPQVSKIVDAGAEVLLMIISQDDAARVANAIADLGADIQLLCLDVCAVIPSYRELAGENANGTISVMLAAALEPNPEVLEFTERFNELTGQDLPVAPDWAMESYDMAMILFDIYARVGTDPTTVIEELNKVTGYKGLSATNLTFTPDQHNALSDPNDYAVVQIQDGELVPLD